MSAWTGRCTALSNHLMEMFTSLLSLVDRASLSFWTSVQGLNRKHDLVKYTNDVCISDYITKLEFSAKAIRERVENERITLFLVSNIQIPAKANRESEENLNKRYKTDPKTKSTETIEI